MHEYMPFSFAQYITSCCCYMTLISDLTKRGLGQPIGVSKPTCPGDTWKMYAAIVSRQLRRFRRAWFNRYSMANFNRAVITRNYRTISAAMNLYREGIFCVALWTIYRWGIIDLRSTCWSPISFLKITFASHLFNTIKNLIENTNLM